MRGTGADLISLNFCLAAVALRTEHFTADQTERRRTAIITIRIWTPEQGQDLRLMIVTVTVVIFWQT